MMIKKTGSGLKTLSGTYFRTVLGLTCPNAYSQCCPRPGALSSPKGSCRNGLEPVALILPLLTVSTSCHEELSGGDSPSCRYDQESYAHLARCAVSQVAYIGCLWAPPTTLYFVELANEAQQRPSLPIVLVGSMSSSGMMLLAAKP